mgnify:CR=1 FL=1
MARKNQGIALGGQIFRTQDEAHKAVTALIKQIGITTSLRAHPQYAFFLDLVARHPTPGKTTGLVDLEIRHNSGAGLGLWMVLQDGDALRYDNISVVQCITRRRPTALRRERDAFREAVVDQMTAFCHTRRDHMRCDHCDRAVHSTDDYSDEAKRKCKR